MDFTRLTADFTPRRMGQACLIMYFTCLTADFTPRRTGQARLIMGFTRLEMDFNTISRKDAKTRRKYRMENENIYKTLFGTI